MEVGSVNCLQPESGNISKAYRVINYPYYFLRLYIPTIVNPDVIEKCFVYLENLLVHKNIGKLFSVVGEHAITVNDDEHRKQFIVDAFRKRKAITFGDRKTNVYMGFSGDIYGFHGEVGTVLIGLKKDVLPNNYQWMESLVVGLCERLNPFWGIMIPEDVKEVLDIIYGRWRDFSGDISTSAHEIRSRYAKRYPHLLKLPCLDLWGAYFRKLTKKEPIEIGWMQYWNKDVCKLYNFPTSNEFDELISNNIKHIQKYGIIWSTSSDPLDLENTVHCQILIDAYDRFDQLGIRVEAK